MLIRFIMLRFLLLVSFIQIMCTPVSAQTIYRMKYRSPLAKDPTIYESFFVLSSNGSGFVRTRIDGGKDVTESPIIEQFAKSKRGEIDTSMLTYDIMDGYVAKGKRFKLPPTRFWFRTNGDNFPIPAGISFLEAERSGIENFTFVQFIPSQELVGNKDLLLTYFSDTSTFYKNISASRSKG